MWATNSWSTTSSLPLLQSHRRYDGTICGCSRRNGSSQGADRWIQVKVGQMSREVVTGYCWPQSARPGDQVGLHLSSSGGRPVRVEVARVGGRREVVFSSDAVAADEHETPKDASSKGC